jgi:N-acetylornithine carbamoyltransferase
MKQFFDLADCSTDEVADLIALARCLQSSPEPHALDGKVLGLLFLNHSLRTLSSFQSGMMRMGGATFVVTPGQSSYLLETVRGAVMDGAAAEHVRDAIPVLATYCDVLGVRLLGEGTNLEADLCDTKMRTIAELCAKPFINLESAATHPCQALADWYTLDELQIPRRGKFVLAWTNHPRAMPLAVPAAAIQMAAMRGMEVVILRPEGYELPSSVMNRARQAARISGGSVAESSNRSESLQAAQVIYAKDWASARYYGDAEQEQKLRKSVGDWCVRRDWFDSTHAECKFMHCLPIRRNVCAADEVLDGPKSVVVQQAYNRMVVQMAILYRMLKPGQ